MAEGNEEDEHDESVDRSNHHDSYFRGVVEHTEDAEGIVRPMMSTELAAQFKWDTLKLESGSFVDKELRSRYSDALFSAETVGGHEILVYMLVEHQSKPDPFIALRLLEYMIRIWWRYIENHGQARTVPLIIPGVVYTGPQGRRWTTPQELSEIIAADPVTLEAAGPLVPRMRYLLDNIAATTLEAIAGREASAEVQVMLMLEKIVVTSDNVTRDLMPYEKQLRLAAVRDGLAIIKYFYSRRKPDREELDEFVDMLGPEGDSGMTSFVDEIRAEGRVEGEARGRIEGRRDALLEVLTDRFGLLPGHITATVRGGSPDEVRTWFRRSITAADLDEVFTDPLR